MTCASRADLVGALAVRRRAAAAAPFAAGLARLARHHRVRQCAGRARADHAVARRPGLRSARRCSTASAPMPSRCSARCTRRHATRSCWCCSAAICRRRRRVPGRLPARALSRDLLRHAEPGAVDDPLRRAGEDRIAGLDRRLQRRTPARSSATRRTATRSNLALFWLTLGVCAVARAPGRRLFPLGRRRARDRRSATTRSASSSSASRSTALIHLKLVDRRRARRARRRAGGARHRPCRSRTWRIGRRPAASCS